MEGSVVAPFKVNLFTLTNRNEQGEPWLVQGEKTSESSPQPRRGSPKAARTLRKIVIGQQIASLTLAMTALSQKCCT